MTDFSGAIARLEATHGEFVRLLANKLATRKKEVRRLMAARLLKRFEHGVEMPMEMTAAEMAETAEAYLDDLLPSLVADAVEVAVELLSQPDAQS